MFQQTPSPPGSVWEANDHLEAQKWPKEDLSSTTDEGAGFYPLRLGETLDRARSAITRKLGWGRYPTVWLARDRKYVLEQIVPLLTNN